MKCNGCGTELVDGGVDWYCPNKSCTFERDAVKKWMAAIKLQKDWERYLLLKEKFEGPESVKDLPKKYKNG